MRKGDIMKNQILETAERLFCTRGYEGTSVQDILDILHSSKGSFYHHFSSKESVLEKLCERRAVIAANEVTEELNNSSLKITDQIDLVMNRMIPLHGSQYAFLKMLLPIFGQSEGRSIRVCYQEALENAFLGILDQTIQKAVDQHEAYPAYRYNVAETCLQLVNDCWYRIVKNVVECNKADQRPDLSLLTRYIATTANTLQRILETPYGSFELLATNDLKLLIDQVSQHWNRFSAQ